MYGLQCWEVRDLNHSDFRLHELLQLGGSILGCGRDGLLVVPRRYLCGGRPYSTLPIGGQHGLHALPEWVDYQHGLERGGIVVCSVLNWEVPCHAFLSRL